MTITKEMFFIAFARHDKGEQYKDIARDTGVVSLGMIAAVY